MSIDDAGEGRPRQKIHQLRKQRLADVHGRLREKNGKTARTAFRRSNRHHPSSRQVPAPVLGFQILGLVLTGHY
jgi:hypothetical protein